MIVGYCNPSVNYIDKDGELIQQITWDRNMKELYFKFNICRTPLDINLLDKNIEDFKAQTDTDPYLFMSFDTAKSLSGDDWHLKEPCHNYRTNIVGYYKDCKAFLDTTKDYGDIELR